MIDEILNLMEQCRQRNAEYPIIKNLPGEGLFGPPIIRSKVEYSIKLSKLLGKPPGPDDMLAG